MPLARVTPAADDVSLESVVIAGGAVIVRARCTTTVTFSQVSADGTSADVVVDATGEAWAGIALPEAVRDGTRRRRAVSCFAARSRWTSRPSSPT